ncbi:MAG: rod shape-determining protein MreD [Pseudomonadota bacterium]
MVEVSATDRWGMRALFVGLVALVGFAMLLPLDPGPGRIPGPDVILLATFAWVLRRPEYVPVWLIAVVFLVCDFLFMRPPGLWAAIVVVGSEMLRSRIHQLRDQSFLLEWASVASVITAMFIAYSLLLALFLVDQPGLGLTLIRLILTLLTYPVVVVLAARTFGVRRMTGGETDQFGRVR